MLGQFHVNSPESMRGCSYFYLKVFVEVIIEKGLKAPLFDRFVFSQREFSDFRDEGPP